MSQPATQQPSRPQPAMPAQPSMLPASTSSAALLQGGNELLIRHGQDSYRLRLTRNDKLILTK